MADAPDQRLRIAEGRLDRECSKRWN
jgi:hypothetical protein